MHKYHSQILQTYIQLAQSSENRNTGKYSGSNYFGSPRPSLSLKNAVKQRVLKDFYKSHKDLSYKDFIALLDSLAQGKTKTERTSLGYLLELYKKHRLHLSLQKIDYWLNYLEGWEEIDTLCQRPFTAKDLTTRWQEWKKLLISLNKSPNISKQRASLVLLVKTVRTSATPEILNMALQNIKNLLPNKNKLITKAVSWLLREMCKQHAPTVVQFIEENKDILPAFVIKEVQNKISSNHK